MIEVYRLINGVETKIAEVSNKTAVHNEAIMAADEVSIDVVTEEALDIADGDYIWYNGLKYTQNRDVDYTKLSNVHYQYNLIFEHPHYKLLDKLFTYRLTGSPEFTLTGKLVDFVDLIAWNMNYHVTNNPRGIDTGWARGAVVDTDYLNLTFSAVSCRDALTQIATAFNAEFYFSADGKTINFVDHIENETGLVFKQGVGNGLYSISQQNVDTKDTITRVYPVGGNKNVPNANADDTGNLKLPELYLENLSEYNRVVEKRVVFEDVFPHFLGTIESVSGTNNCEIVCSAIDFDINALAVGDNARINFLTGSLMGIAFQFQFDYANKKVTLIPQNDDTALTNDDGTTPQVPVALKKAAVGDKFNFTGIVMPASYVNTAITKLREKATSWLAFYSRKRVKFGLDIDYRWMRGKQQLHPGDLVTILIPERSINKTIRITETNLDLYEGKINATVSNYLDENWEKKVEGAISSLQTTVNGGGGLGNSVDILERYDERPLSDRNVMSSLRVRREALSRLVEDTAAERITFDKGAVVRDLATKDFVQDKFMGTGAGLFDDEHGNSVLEVDKLSVRKEAWFNEVIINQIRFQGGIVVYSAANMEVLTVSDGGSYLELHFDTKNGQVHNTFEIDDQIRCQRFSGASIIKYYMSRVTSIGDDFIRISKTDIDGTLNVEVGDQIVQFGNRTNTDRQALIEVNVLDGGKQTFYQGVNSYNLTDKNYIDIGRVRAGDGWVNIIRSYGNAYIGSRDGSTYMAFNENTQELEIRANVEFKLPGGGYKDVTTALFDVQTAAATDATNKVNAVQVGGRNLLTASDRVLNVYNNLYIPATKEILAEKYDNQEISRISFTPNANQIVDIQSALYNHGAYTAGIKQFTAGQQCVVSIYWRLVTSKPVVVGLTASNIKLWSDVKTVDVGSGWKRSVAVRSADTQTKSDSLFFSFKCPTALAGETITIDWACPQLELGNKETDWTPAQEDIAAEIAANKSYIDTITAGLQNQIDGVVDSWFFPYTPTLDNEPASLWNDNTKKGRHVGDTFTNTQTYVNDATTPNAGKSWRFVVNNGVYSWAPIADSDAVKALLQASKAQDTADNKRRVFTNIPAPPYEVGDLWAAGGGGDLKKCIASKAAGAAYSSSDWNLATKYTDDSKANTVQASLEKYKGNRNLVLNTSEGVVVDSAGWVTNKWKLSGAMPSGSATYTIRFYYDSDTDNDIGISLGDSNGVYDGTYELLASLSADGIYQSLVTFNKGVQTNLCIYANKYIYIDRLMLIEGNYISEDYQPAPEDAATTASSALTRVNAVASDGILSGGSEKSGERSRWNVIASEKSGLDTQADSFSITTEKTTYGAKFQALATYLNAGTTYTSGVPSWLADANLQTDTAITSSVYRQKWEEYYTARTALVNSISTKSKQLADAAQSTADNIKIGGRNLLLNSKLMSGKWGTDYSSYIYEYNGYMFFAPTTAWGNAWFSIPVLELGKTYTMSFDALGTTPFKVEFSGVISKTFNPNASTVPTRCVITFTLTNVLPAYNVMYLSIETVGWSNMFRNFKMEQGNKPTDWTPAPEDTDAKFQAAYDKAAALDYIAENIGEGSTEVNNGLVLSNVIGVKDGNGTVTAGMNGANTSSNDVRFWAGSNFTNRDTAPFRVYEDGTMEMGNEKDGYRVSVSRDKIDTLTQLIASLGWTDVGGSSTYTDPYYGQISIPIASGTYMSTRERIFTLSKYSKIHLITRNNLMYHSYNTYEAFGTRTLMTKIVNLDTGATVYENTGTINYQHQFIAPNEYFDTYSRDTDLTTYLPAGNYKVISQVGIQTTGYNSNYASVSYYTYIDKMDYRPVPNRTMVATNGFATIADELKYLYMSLDDTYLLRTIGALLFKSPSGLNQLELTDTAIKMSGATDIPGVLASGSVASWGTHTVVWGAKKNTANATYTATGIYDVPHSAGSSYNVNAKAIGDNLNAFIVSKGNNTFRVQIRNSAGTATTGAFDYWITGSN